MIFLILSLVSCINITNEKYHLCNQSIYKDSPLFMNIKNVINAEHEIITKDSLLKFFEGEKYVLNKVAYLFSTLQEAYKIISDRNLGLLKNLMIGNYDIGESYNLLNYNSIVLSNLLTRLVHISNYNLDNYEPIYYSTNNLFMTYLPLNYTYPLNSETYTKIEQYFNNKKNPSVKKMSFGLNFIDKILVLEILYLSASFDKEQKYLLNFLPPTEKGYSLRIDFTNILFRSNYINDNAYILLGRFGSFYSKISGSLLSIFYKTYEDGPVFSFSNNLCGINLLNPCYHNPSIGWVLNKTVCMENKFTDIYISQLKYHCELSKLDVLAEIKKIDDSTSSIRVINIGSDYTVDLFLDCLKEKCDSTKKIKELLEKNIKEDKLHSFTTVLDLITYSFKKPTDLDAGNLTEEISKKPSKCLRLSCGHFVGEELLEEYFTKLEFKCHMCNIKTTIKHYFEAEVFQEED
jgi:hypothetical protein